MPFSAKRIIDDWRKKFLNKQQCPICAISEWQVRAEQYLLLRVSARTPQLFSNGVARRHRPLVVATCTHCGYMASFCAQALGLRH